MFSGVRSEAKVGHVRGIRLRRWATVTRRQGHRRTLSGTPFRRHAADMTARLYRATLHGGASIPVCYFRERQRPM